MARFDLAWFVGFGQVWVGVRWFGLVSLDIV